MEGFASLKTLLFVLTWFCRLDPSTPIVFQIVKELLFTSSPPSTSIFSNLQHCHVSHFAFNDFKRGNNRHHHRIIPGMFTKSRSSGHDGTDDLKCEIEQELERSRSLLASEVITKDEVTMRLRALESLAGRWEAEQSSQGLGNSLDDMMEHLRAIQYNLPVDLGSKRPVAKFDDGALNISSMPPHAPQAVGGSELTDRSAVVTEDLKEAIFESDIQIKEARRLLGIANPDNDDLRYIEQVQLRLKDIIQELEDKSADFKKIISQHALIDEAIMAKDQADDVMKLLREFQYNVPTNILRSREAQISSKTKKKRITYNLSKISNLKELVDILSKSIEGDVIVATDLALCLNNLKRLQWQAKGFRDVQQVQQLVVRIASLISDAVNDLEPRHVALSLNALASFPLNRKEFLMEEKSRVGMEIPHTWRLEEDYSYMAREFERGEMVVVQIESKVPRFGVIGGEGDMDGSYVVYYEDGFDAKCCRSLDVGKIGKILDSDFEILKKRMIMFFHIGTALLTKEMLFACNSQDIATVIWSSAKMKIADRQVFQRLVEQMDRSSLLSSMRSRDIATIMWSFSQLGYTNLELVSKLMNHFVMERNLESAFGQDVANVLSSMAKMRVFHSKTFYMLGKRVIAMSKNEKIRANSLSISSVLSSFAQVNFLRTDLLLQLDDLFLSLPDQHVNMQTCCNLLWSHAVFRIPDAPLCAHILRLMIREKQRLDKSDKYQLHLFFLSLSAVGEELSTLLQGEDSAIISDCERLKEECKDFFMRTSSDVNSVSDSQASLARCARRLGSVEEEHVLEDSGYTVDIWMPGREWDRVRIQGQEAQIRWLESKLGLSMQE
ncbi:hypothetical protein GUITHDRAFT_163457 [Guillardia theta CCMP2712]|uniref:RAP domain-containing protein n=1 Tax=Guillardia theta (strain CCMP2712) TaxID=905079 RepID=L1J8F6_GUITC|nr:hypothetical protein GUITHDRAFT_163457 [Guillardia theta CCMP2712]EKX44823.1 hypothetical protein GUITHDRAFT_163457 [Guillardia theta CCMP2712]|eukprot:XP_005831803.1 hypothetical protein GUITHDRAFT_163457 [Guillardia theta CCMP2712]